MKYIFCILIFSSTVLADSVLHCQSKEMPPSREVQIENKVGFLFNKKITTMYLKAQKEVNFLAYWPITECNLLEVEMALDSLLALTYPNQIYQPSSDYIRQYFPFVTRRGQFGIYITFSKISTDDEDVIDRMSKYFRSVFDGGKDYLSFIYSYSENEILSSAQ